MATSTTNISNVSISVSGNTTKTATISWSLPSIPAGSTISSCTLTGTASSFTTGNKGATLTIGSTSVSSRSSFTVNLGNNNSTTSVTASFQGNHKQSNTSVTLSNLKYTVTYTEPLATYTVTFKDWDGTVLKTQSVEEGNSATAPSNPSRTGYRFIGWDKTFTNITSDLTITAQYEQIITYTVTFVDYNGTILKTQTVEAGNSAIAPTSPSRAGYKFTGWDKSFSNITSNLTITAQYVIWYALNIKDIGSWVDIGKVFRKVNGVWVEETNEEWINLFNTNTDYRRKEIPTPTAILYEDGTFIFSPDTRIYSSHGNIIATYIGWDTVNYLNTEVPWRDYLSTDIYYVYFNNINVLSTNYWFLNSSTLETVDCVGLSGAIDTTSMFYNCSVLASLDLSGFDTSNVTNMYGMFYNCSSLTSLDLSNFDTSNVANMHGMFQSCSALSSLDLSNFDTSNVTTMYAMFYSCSSLTSLDLSNFDMSNVTNTDFMFGSCTNLKTIYVKDQTAKTKIESSTNFPSTATVIIGSPT